MTALGIVLFVVALLVSVTLHELGHFVTARRYGMKATQFFVGFGPTLWSVRRGETEYGLKAIPAGGFVKIVGMTPLEELEPGEEERAFFRQPARRKTVVLAAGSTMHGIIAVTLIFGATWGIGVVNPDAAVLSAPARCVLTTLEGAAATGANRAASEECPADTSVPAPAAAAGVQAGDRVVAVDGVPVADYRQVVEAIRSHPGTPLDLRVERDGREVDLTLTPAAVYRPSLTDPRDVVLVGAVGVSRQLTAERPGFTGAVEETGVVLKDMVVGTYEALTTKLATVTKVYSADRDVEGVVGAVGAARIGGDVLAAPEPTSIKVLSFLILVAGINLFVGVFNLLPLLPLDGGHIAVVAFEQARDRLRRLRGHVGELQRVDYNKLLPMTYGVALLFIVFTVFVAGADLVNPIRLAQ